VILEASAILNAWAGRPLEGIPLPLVLDAWAISRLQGGATLVGSDGFSVSISHPVNGKADELKANLVVFVDPDDPARIFLGLKHIRCAQPPYRRLKKTLGWSSTGEHTPSTTRPPTSTTPRQSRRYSKKSGGVLGAFWACRSVDGFV